MGRSKAKAGQQYVYQHHRSSDDLVFYVGKGTGRRAWEHQNRNPHWVRTVQKYGFYVVIVKENLTDQEAFALEAELIKRFGRRDKKSGTLVNLSDGGEGVAGRVVGDEERKRMSRAAKARLADPTQRAAVSNGMKKWASNPENRSELLKRAKKATECSRSIEAISKMTASHRRRAEDPEIRIQLVKRAKVLHTPEAKRKNLEARKAFSQSQAGREQLLRQLEMGRKRAYSSEASEKKSQSLKKRMATAEGRLLLDKAIKAAHTPKANRLRAQALSQPYPSFRSPDGTIYPPGVGLGDFAKQHGLQRAHLSSVIYRKLKHHKGWTLASEAPPSKMRIHRKRS